MNLHRVDALLWVCIAIAISGTTESLNSTIQAPTTAALTVPSAPNTTQKVETTSHDQLGLVTKPIGVNGTKSNAIQVPTKPGSPTKPSVGNNTSSVNHVNSHTIGNRPSTVQPISTTTTIANSGNVAKVNQSSANGNSNVASPFNEIIETLTNGLNSLIQNITGVTSNGQPPTFSVQNLPQIAAILGNFLPGESKNILTEIAQNQSAITPENLYKLAGPILQVVGAQLLTQTGVSEKCSEDLGIIINAILSREQWALSMLDAMFKLPPNILGSVMGGHPKLLGEYDECIDVKATTADIEGQYCTAYTSIPVPNALTQTNGTAFVGLCVSKSCSTSDIKTMINSLESQLLNNTTPYEFEVTCSERKEWGSDMIAVTCFLSILTAMIFFSTLYDVCAVRKRNNKNQKENESQKHTNGGDTIVRTDHVQLHEHKNGISNGGYVAEAEIDKSKMDAETKFDSTSRNGNVSVAIETKQNATPQPQTDNIAERVCLSFSVYSNGVKLLSTNQGAGSLGVVNGVRFLSMAWVILGHTYYFALGYDQNATGYFLKSLSDWSFMAISSATVSVDSFFALSGVLVAYLTLKQLKKVGGASKMNWFMFYFHRFWRLTPPYMLVIMVGTVVLPYVVEGPMSSNNDLPFMHGCRKNWWKNILYINNYLTADMCLGWSWYLANDMQFYIISPLILLPFFYNAVAGIIVSGAFLLATIASAGFVTHNHEYSAQMFSPFAHPPKDAKYSENIYIPSYARMGPYIVGLVTGYMLYRCKRLKCRIPRMVNLTCWLLCFGITCATIYGLYTDGDSHVLGVWESTVFIAVHRTGWGMAVCWVIFSCATGNGGWLNEILSWNAFVPLGRLTYCAYLVHPLVMVVYYMSKRTTIYFTTYEAIYMFLAHMVMSYGVAFVASLFFESPMMGLEKAVFQKNK